MTNGYGPARRTPEVYRGRRGKGRMLLDGTLAILMDDFVGNHFSWPSVLFDDCAFRNMKYLLDPRKIALLYQ